MVFVLVWLTFHLLWRSLGPSMLLQMALFQSFLWLGSIPLYICTHSFFIPSSVDGHMLLLCPGYCEYCCYECWGTCIFSNTWVSWTTWWESEPLFNSLLCLVAAVVAKSLQSCLTVRNHRRQPTRLRHPWDSPGKNTGVGCHFLFLCKKVKSESEVAQLCLTLHDPMDCSPPGSSVHGIFQARVLEWGAIAFSSAWLSQAENLSEVPACSLISQQWLLTSVAKSLPWGPESGRIWQ